MLLLKINNKLRSRFLAFIRTNFHTSNTFRQSNHRIHNPKINVMFSDQTLSISHIFNKCMEFGLHPTHESNEATLHFYLNVIQQFSTLFSSFDNALEHIHHLLTFAQLIRQKTFQIEQFGGSLTQGLKSIIQKPNVSQMLESLVQSLSKSQNLWLKIRLIYLISFLSVKSRQKYLQSVAPFVENMNKYQILTLIVETERQTLRCDYKLFEKICANQFFRDLDELKYNYLKLKFFKKFQGKFMHNKISPYAAMIRKLQLRKVGVEKGEELRYLEILRHCLDNPQNYSQWHRMSYFFDNSFIQRSQREVPLSKQFQYLMHLYEIQNSNQNSEHLLPIIIAHKDSIVSQIDLSITYFNRFYNVFINVINYAKPKLKYENNRNEIKEYTSYTLSFIQIFLPKLVTVKPEVIFELSPIAYQLSLSSVSNICRSLINTIKTTFQTLHSNKEMFAKLLNSNDRLSILEFYLHFSTHQHFQIDEMTASFFIFQFQLNLKKKNVSQKQYKLLYQLLRYMETHNKFDSLLSIYANIYTNIFEPQMLQIINQQSQEFRRPLISCYSKKLIYFALTANHLKKKQFQINDQLLVSFSNKILRNLIKSLEYEQIHSALELYTQLRGINAQIYECLVSNFSCFLICVHKVYYLNNRYASICEQLCRLILENKQLFRAIPNKQNLKFFQIIYYTINNKELSQQKITDIYQIIEDQNYLIKSIATFASQKMISTISKKKINNIFIQMYKKIKSNTNYDFKTSFGLEKQVVCSIDLQRQIDEVISKNLVRNQIQNEFLLTKRILPRYSKHQIWSKYQMIHLNPKIHRDNLSVLTPSQLNQIEQNLLKGLSGNQEKIKQVLAMYDYNENLEPLVSHVELNAKYHGALITVPSKDNLMLISTNKQNYEILYICAHALTLMGSKVYLINEKDDIAELLAQLNSTYSSIEQICEENFEDQNFNQDNGKRSL